MHETHIAGRMGGGDHWWMRRQYTNEQRTELVELVLRGGATTSNVAGQMGVGLSTAYNWVKQARERVARSERSLDVSVSTVQAAPAPKFVRLVRAADSPRSLTVTVAGADICVRRDFDPQLLRAVVEALRGDGQ